MRDKTVPTREDARREMRLAVSEKKARETQAIFDAVVSFGDTTPTSSVLDVGCGGGRVTTYSWIKDAALARIERGNLKHLKHPFPHNMGVHRVYSLASPADAVAFDEAYIRSLYKGHGLSIVEPIGYGTWCRHEGFYNR